MILFGYDTKNDAHKTSNYNWWKKHHNFITDVDIDLGKLGVSDDKMQELFKGIVYCFKTKTAFALHDDNSSFVIFMPEFMRSKQGDIIVDYSSEKQMLNAIKLVLLVHHNILIYQPQIENETIRKEIQP